MATVGCLPSASCQHRLMQQAVSQKHSHVERRSCYCVYGSDNPCGSWLLFFLLFFFSYILAVEKKKSRGPIKKMCLTAHNSILGFLEKLLRVRQPLLQRDRMLFGFSISAVFLLGTWFYVILTWAFSNTTFFFYRM